MARADPAARPGRRHEQDQPAAYREQNGEETGRPGCVAYTSQTSRLGASGNGTKRARIGKASGSTDRLLCPDAVRHMSVTIATQ